MSAVTARRIAILEPATIYVLIMGYIWSLRFTHRPIWMGILALVMVSHRVHQERGVTLGFRYERLRECCRMYAPALALLALMSLGCGMLLHTTRKIALDQAFLSWAAYLPWGLFQQYILNGYFLNRFDALLPRRSAMVVSAALFSGAHLPNWFLMGVTLLAGCCCAHIYRKYKNLYFLGLAHATIGFLLFLVVPDSISHHMKVGP